MNELLILLYILFDVFYSIKRSEGIGEVTEFNSIFFTLISMIFFPIMFAMDLAMIVNKINKLNNN
jgi:hypothetical protein